MTPAVWPICTPELEAWLAGFMTLEQTKYFSCEPHDFAEDLLKSKGANDPCCVANLDPRA